MKKIIKNISGTLRLLRYSKVNPWLLTMMEYQKQLIDKCVATGEPILGKIDIELGALPIENHPFMSYWICVGNRTPFDRLEELRKERDELRKILEDNNIKYPAKAI